MPGSCARSAEESLPHPPASRVREKKLILFAQCTQACGVLGSAVQACSGQETLLTPRPGAWLAHNERPAP